MKPLKQIAKRLFSATILILLCSNCFSVTSFSEEQDEPSTIIALENTDYLTNLPAVEIIQNTSGDIEDLYYFVFSLLNVNATVQHPDGTTETMALSVSWNCTDYTKEQIDPSVLGSYTETGTIELPVGNYEWGEGVLQTLTVPVNVIVPEEPILLTSTSDYPAQAYSMEQGEDISEIISQISSTISCYTESGKAYVANIIWNTENIDTQTAGVYAITGTLSTPMHCVFSEELKDMTLSISISVQEPGKPNIDCFIIYYDYLMHFPWEMPEESLDSVQAWLQQDDGEWIQLSEDNMDMEYSSDYFGLYLDILSSGHDYRLQIDYDGGQTSIATFHYNDEGIQMKSVVDGDRDGGDTEGNTDSSEESPLPSASPILPTPGPEANTTSAPNTNTSTDTSTTNSDSGTTPAKPDPVASVPPVRTETDVTSPSASSHGNSRDTENTEDDKNTGDTKSKSVQQQKAFPRSSEPVSTAISKITAKQNTEEYHSAKPNDSSTDVTRLSGAELLLMLETSEMARFSLNGITLSCPASSLKALNISTDDTLEIKIVPRDKNGFTLHITLNGSPITELSGMEIMVPFASVSDSPTLSLLDGDGNLVTEGTYDSSKKLAIFTIDHTGDFSIHDENASEQSSTNPKVIVFVVVLVIIILLLIFFVLHKIRRTHA